MYRMPLAQPELSVFNETPAGAVLPWPDNFKHARLNSSGLLHLIPVIV
jgi:hypothetical protein